MDGLKMRTGKYFEVSAKLTRTQEDGEEKRVKETVVVEAESFGDAEEKALTEYDGYDVDIVSVSIAPYKEVLFSKDGNDDKFYKAKVEFISIDDKTGKEQRTKVVYLVQASSLSRALTYIDKVMKEAMIDYVSVAATGTSVEAVFLKGEVIWL